MVGTKSSIWRCNEIRNTVTIVTITTAIGILLGFFFITLRQWRERNIIFGKD